MTRGNAIASFVRSTVTAASQSSKLASCWDDDMQHKESTLYGIHHYKEALMHICNCIETSALGSPMFISSGSSFLKYSRH